MNCSRRRFIRTAGGTGLLLGLGSARALAGALPASGRRTLAAPEGVPLRFPPPFAGGTMTAEETTANVWPDITTRLWTLGGSWPAPTIRVRRGETFSARLVNRLQDPTIVHWHGLIVPHDMDGHPSNAIDPMGAYDYSFKVDQRAGTYWYHPHPHHLTGEQVYMGMAGFFIVEDDEEAGLGLPDGEYDLPLLLQDRRLGGVRDMIYAPIINDHEDGYLGDTPFVNGTPDPYHEVARGLYRLRILNGSNARIFNIGFADGRTFHLIASDGGLLDRPYQAKNVSISPAERVEILVDFSGDPIGTSVEFRSIRTAAGTGNPPPQGAEMTLLRFDVVREATETFTVPEALSTVERIDPSLSVRDRTFELQVRHGASEDGHLINGLPYRIERVDWNVPFGDVETWTLWNRSSNPHPMHIHGTQFQVLDRAGSTALPPAELGWKDTVLVLPFQTMRILVRFDRHEGVYLLHCHNLEHEDHGMMANFTIGGTVGVDDPEPIVKLDLQ